MTPETDGAVLHSPIGDPRAAAQVTPVPVRRQHMRGTSLQTRVLNRSLRYTVRPFLSVWSRTESLPWPFGVVDRAGALLPPINGTSYQPVQFKNCTGEWLRGPGSRQESVVLYLHGGAFLCCGVRTHRRLASRISTVSQSSVLMVDYRMLPADASISESIDDCLDAYRWLLDAGYTPDRITVVGDSAGGYLAFAVPLAIRDAGLPMPASIVAMSPLTELDPTNKVQGKNADRCAMFPKRAIPQLTRLAEKVDAVAMSTRGQHPRRCPVDADLAGLPPVLIQAGSTEILLRDSELIAERLGAAGVPVELQVWDRQPHVFQVAADLVPEGERAINEIGRFIRTAHGALISSVR